MALGIFALFYSLVIQHAKLKITRICNNTIASILTVSDDSIRALADGNGSSGRR